MGSSESRHSGLLPSAYNLLRPPLFLAGLEPSPCDLCLCRGAPKGLLSSAGPHHFRLHPT